MGSLQSSPSHQDYVDLAEKTGFSFEQISILHKRFKQLSHNEDKLRREHFGQITDLHANPIREQIVEAFFDKRNFYQEIEEPVSEISFENFLVVMSNFRPPSDNMSQEKLVKVREEKLRFLFNMHDTDKDGTITLEEYRHVVEELLSYYEALETETARGIADAAMLEVASITRGHMEPDEFYEGITFEHFLKLLEGFDIESRMNIRFMNMDTTTLWMTISLSRLLMDVPGTGASTDNIPSEDRDELMCCRSTPCGNLEKNERTFVTNRNMLRSLMRASYSNLLVFSASLLVFTSETS